MITGILIISYIIILFWDKSTLEYGFPGLCRRLKVRKLKKALENTEYMKLKFNEFIERKSCGS